LIQGPVVVDRISGEVTTVELPESEPSYPYALAAADPGLVAAVRREADGTTRISVYSIPGP